MSKFLWTQRQDIGPTPRANAGLAYDSARQRTVLFGGQTGSGPSRETWAWDGSLWTQVEDVGPPARAGHALAFDGARNRLVLFGGIAGTTVFNDTWEWDGTVWTPIADTGPSARQGLALAFSSKLGRVVSDRNRTVLFGGGQQSGSLGDTWEFYDHGGS